MRARSKPWNSLKSRNRRRLAIERFEPRRLLAIVGLGSNEAPKSPISESLLSYAADYGLIGPRETSSSGLAASLLTDADGRVGIRVASTDANSATELLAPLGFEVIATHQDLHFAEGLLPPTSVRSLHTLLGDVISGVTPIYRPITHAGSVTSQADVVHESQRVRDSLPVGYDGNGTTIGVLSDSYNALGGAAADITSGDLPSGINVLQDLSGSGLIDEGRAMLQLIHDVAPGSSLAFATAFTGQSGFAQNILDLADPTKGNADIIVDDVFYFAEPFFQDGIIAQAVDTVVGQGASYFSSAGNSADQSYETSSPGFGTDSFYAGSFLDFDPSGSVDTRQRITIPNGGRATISLQWDDPFYTASGVDTDIDIYLLEAGTNTILAGSSDDNLANQSPVEILQFTNSTGATNFDLLIHNFAGPNPQRVKYIDFGDSTIVEFDTNSPTAIGHSAAAGASGVGAVFYGDQTVPESFTSKGPATILFNASGSPLGTAEVRNTPRIAAVDGTNTTFFGSDVEGDGFPNFFGTSAAAPHAAAVAALVLDANPSFTPSQIYGRLEGTAIDLLSPGVDNLTGAGLVNAFDAVFGPATPATLNKQDGFETGVLSANWETHSTGPGRIQVSAADGPASGSYHLKMDTFASFGLGLNEAILRVDTTGFTDVNLSFAFREYNDEDDAMSASFVGSENSDGVALSVDGVNWYRIIELTDSTGNAPDTYTSFGPFNLTALAAANSLTLGNDVRIKFQQFDNFPVPTDGFGFDDVVVSGSVPATTDLGDAPTAAQSGLTDSYPTLLADDGAVHTVISGFSLGPSVDTEPDGQPSVAADLDDVNVDDEDGVTFTNNLVIGNFGTAVVDLTNSAGLANPFLNAWVDFNQDGDWDDIGEAIYSGSILAGSNSLTFAVPNSAPAGLTYARFRLHDGTSPLLPSGAAASGEVEDYRIAIAAPASWIAQGPGPAINGQVENVSPQDQVIGAIHTVAAHPTDADVLWIGSVNGGVWRTDNATASAPNWTPLTDQQQSLSIGALELDPTDSSHNTLVAGIGRYSSYGRIGDSRNGLLRSADGGVSWTTLNGGGTLQGANISGVAPRGSNITASVNVADSFTCSNIGIFHSTDGGTSFTQRLAGVSYDLASHPSNVNVMYSSLVFGDVCTGGAQPNGVYRSVNGGLTWSKVSDPAMDALIINSNTSNLEISVGASGEVYAAIINTGNLAGLFRSPSGNTGSWIQMDTPATNENGTDVGLNPRGAKGPPAGSPMEEIAGGQGSIHFSIRSDPSNANIVYVGGDRQPRSNGDAGSFPNSIGALDFSGRLFRCDASQPAGNQCVHLTHSNTLGAAGGGTASSSAPHADSREMVFDAAGNIIEVDDGGIYRRTSPQSNTGDWFSIIGDMQVTEQHDIAYDSLSNTLISGNQDTGTTFQIESDATMWNSLSTADGGDVAVDDSGSTSFRYSSFQNLGAFRRTEWDSSGNLLNTTFLSGIADPHFNTPFELNAVDPTRILIGGSSNIHERGSRGSGADSLVACAISSCGVSSGSAFYGDPLAFGHISDPDLIVVGSSSTVVARTGGSGSALTPTAGVFPGGEIIDVVLDPTVAGAWYVLTGSAVFQTTNSGANWTQITGNLGSLSSDFRSIDYVEGILRDALLVSTNEGVFIANSATSFSSWSEIGTGLPNNLVFDSDYDPSDDVLVVGTMGRGAWLLPDIQRIVGGAAPSDISLSNQEVNENSAIGTVVGTLSTHDLDFFDTHTYSLIAGAGDTDNSSFQIVGGQLLTNTDIDFESQSSFSIRVRSTDSDGLSVERQLLISAINLPEVTSTQINDGGTTRSQITSLTVTFDSEVDAALLSGAFVLTNIDTSTQVTSLVVGTPVVSGGQTQVNLTFASGPSVIDRLGTGALGNSLADGNYRLDILASNVQLATGGLSMASNHVFGGQLFGESNNDDFFRLFGDGNGDGVRNGLDLNAIIPSLFDPNGYREDFDSNGDGVINGIDLNALIPTIFGPGRQ